MCKPKCYESKDNGRCQKKHFVNAAQFDGSIKSRNEIKVWLGPNARILCGDLHVADSLVRPGDWVIRFQSGWVDTTTAENFNTLYKVSE